VIGMRVNPQETTEHVQLLERRRFEAMVTGDLAVTGPLLSADLWYRHSSGRLDGRDSLMDRMRGRTERYLGIDHQEDHVVVLDRSVVLIGRWRLRRMDRDREATSAMSHVSVWSEEQHDSTWRLVAYQGSPLVGEYDDPHAGLVGRR